MTTQYPSLPVLERQVAERRLADAVRTSIEILHAIDTRYGRLEHIELGEIASDGTAEDVALVFCTRFAAAFGRVMADPDVPLTTEDFERLLTHHRWIDLIFSLSGYRTSDHVVPVLARPTQGTSLTFDGLNFLRFLILRSMNSRIHANLEDYWKVSSVGTALAFLHYVGSRYVFWPRAFEFREQLLEWLPGRLGPIKLGELTLARLPEIYMHCSYAVGPRKHAIKADLMRQMRSACLEYGCTEASAQRAGPLPSRPTVVVVGENFHVGHAVHRTHSRVVAALRERFHVVGVIHPDPSGTPIASLFDECLPITGGEFLPQVKHLADAILERKPVLILYLGVGMVSQVIALSSLRLAPVQCVSFGHTATTMSEVMDYFVLPEDFAGAAHTFSEKVAQAAEGGDAFRAASLHALRSAFARRHHPRGRACFRHEAQSAPVRSAGSDRWRREIAPGIPHLSARRHRAVPISSLAAPRGRRFPAPSCFRNCRTRRIWSASRSAICSSAHFPTAI